MRPLAVLSVASEIFPLIKTGGLGDVTGALPGALSEAGVTVRTLIPGYPSVIGALDRARTVWTSTDLFGGNARVLAGHAAELDLLVLDAPHLYERPGNPYLGPDGQDWPDNAIRFAALARVAADLAAGAMRTYAPKVIHAHDWQAGLLPAFLRYRSGSHPPSVMTVHNLSFPGKAPRELLGRLGLPPDAYAVDGVEFHGAISFLKAGLWFADRITTVSPTYAAGYPDRGEQAWALAVCCARAPASFSGILNGIDTTIWNPGHRKLDRRAVGSRLAGETNRQQDGAFRRGWELS